MILRTRSIILAAIAIIPYGVIGIVVWARIIPWHEAAAIVLSWELGREVCRVRRRMRVLESKNKAFLHSLAIRKQPRGAIPLVTKGRERFS